MRTESLQAHEPLHQLHQCPNCSRQALVQQNSNQFYCLSCGFRQDTAELRTIDYPSLVAILLLFGLIVVLL
ncbi:hypothetical protein IQ268_12920 [Oculatella sp. LEGE 06141]|uniref:hypothetical protein n=1 Tax=Oculatella sp. LEGE 06141 TaxID=1828648 RepID=UPI00187E1C64|nr:hypothetical protein [Oculatella sp. LEGE 06141]MBE9179465.1 hypothetical protein [Oculatella sp. LEGE 06141]